MIYMNELTVGVLGVVYMNHGVIILQKKCARDLMDFFDHVLLACWSACTDPIIVKHVTG